MTEVTASRFYMKSFFLDLTFFLAASKTAGEPEVNVLISFESKVQGIFWNS